MAFLPLVCLLGYFGFLLLISFFTGKNTSNEAFFLGSKNSPWYLVSFGMIGASLSGMTFVSVPGWVEAQGFVYMQMTIGMLFGYLVTAYVLLPIYYTMELTSIYSYLGRRFGKSAETVGGLFFLLSRGTGAALRLLLVAGVFQLFFGEAYGLRFEVTVAVTLALIWLYTFRSGIQTILWTDALQTASMLLALVFTIHLLCQHFSVGLAGAYEQMDAAGMTRWWNFEEYKASSYWVKYVLGGMFVTIAMTGLDQDMMQKNLSCRNLKDAQKNMVVFGAILLVVNGLFLFLGGLLTLYAQEKGITVGGDQLFPTIALEGSLGAVVGVTFLIGLIASAYSSADSALTSLTTVIYTDFFPKKWQNKRSLRTWLHLAVTAGLFFLILAIKPFADASLINTLFTYAGYTYGSLLGLFAFGIFTDRSLPAVGTVIVAIGAPILTFFIASELKVRYGFDIGYLNLLLNGGLNVLFLSLISNPSKAPLAV